MSKITPNNGDRSIVRVGVDLAKRVIQVHAVDAAGKRRVIELALERRRAAGALL